MNEPIQITYREVVITYREANDSWNCELFHRPAESLAAAKHRIDKHLDKEKEKPFVKFKAFARNLKPGGSTLVEVTVGGLDEDHTRAFVSNATQRGWVWVLDIFPASPENVAIVQQIHQLTAEKEKIDEKIQAERIQLEAWKP